MSTITTTYIQAISVLTKSGQQILYSSVYPFQCILSDQFLCACRKTFLTYVAFVSSPRQDQSNEVVEPTNYDTISNEQRPEFQVKTLKIKFSPILAFLRKKIFCYFWQKITFLLILRQGLVILSPKLCGCNCKSVGSNLICLGCN